MNRCFTNNNIIPIKSSKEHIEDKRNNAMFCNYAKKDHWTPTEISDKNLEKKHSNLFLINGSNKIIKAKNHTHFLNLSKGLFNRKLLLHSNTLKNKDFWERTKTLDRIKERNMLTVLDISQNIEEFNKNEVLNEEDFHYYNGNQINDLGYLELNESRQSFSSFAIDSLSNLTVDDMGTHKEKIIPFCFNLHNSYTLPPLENTDPLFGAGFELFGNFNKTDVDPRKSKLIDIYLNPVGKAVPSNINGVWDKEAKAYKWGVGWGGVSGSDNDSLNISGIGLVKTKKWSLIMDIKVEGDVGTKFLPVPITDAADEEKIIREDDNILFLFRSVDETSTDALSLSKDAGSTGTTYNKIDQGVALVNGTISFAGITFDHDFVKGKWYTLAFSFKFEDDQKPPDINIYKKEIGVDLDDFVKLTKTGAINTGELKKIIWIGDKIELFRQTYSKNADTVVNNSDDGWIKNIYFTKNEIDIENIKNFKSKEYNPIN